MKYFILLAALLLSLNLSIAMAEPMSEADLPFRYTSDSIEYDVSADGSFTETAKWSTIILKESALKDLKEGSVTFSTSVAKGEILEAYTLKRTGERIDAPKSSYQVSTNNGYSNGSPLYSDETTITVVFPDLAVGDSTMFAYRVTNREGMFPDQFSIYHIFSRFKAYDDVSIKITAPKKMRLRTKSYFLTEQPIIEKDGKQIMKWLFQNRRPEKWTPAESGIAIEGEEPSLYISTFDSYKQISEAYAKRAVPKAAVTERVKALAAEIVNGKKTSEDRARTLYDWVAKNIAFGGN
jgi:transglutaminase-like putative cysteine protease